MKKSELTKLLKRAGFEKTEGGRHEIWIKEDIQVVVSRTKKEIPTGTANKILKTAGLK